MAVAASVGIDIAEARKGLDLVGLDRDRTVMRCARRLTVEEAASMCLALRPDVVCIDSPSGWALSGRSRVAERRLSAVGIQSYRTGPDPGLHPFYAWMRVGFAVYGRLSSAYPLYRGGPVAGTAAEVFPHASACLLAGELRSKATPKGVFRRGVLREHGVDERELRTIDQVDAALGALTGLIALERGHCALGDPAEGMLIVPVRELPARLPRPGRDP